MPFVLAAVDVPDQERQYYAGPNRKVIPGRKADKITHLLDQATVFDTEEAAESMNRELGGTYQVIAPD